MNNKDSAVALITGASSGIGLVTAKALQRAGYRVFGTSRKAPASITGITMDLRRDRRSIGKEHGSRGIETGWTYRPAGQ